ncbi:hypothetical protein KA005_25545 [bacterium]|nr:hypothetical protein [bacterium]
MEKPKIRISVLKKLYSIALKVSPIEKRYRFSSTRTEFAQQVFEKALLVIGSYIRLIPDFDKKEKHKYDFSTLASLSRTLVELNHVYNYICRDKIGKDELEFRIELMELHRCHETDNVLQGLGFSRDFIEEAISYSRFVDEWFLKENEYFKNLNENVRNQLLRGKNAFYRGNSIKKNYEIDKRTESALYKLFSNNIHSFRLGIQPQHLHSLKVPLNLISLFFLSTESGIIYFSSILRSYMALRWKVCRGISKAEKQFVKDCTNMDYLRSWVNYNEKELFKGEFSLRI